MIGDGVQRQVRRLFKAKGGCGGSTLLLGGEKVTFGVRLLLPVQLPPSFHGTAVRFAYHVSASCRVALHRDEVLTSHDSLDAASQVLRLKSNGSRPSRACSAHAIPQKSGLHTQGSSAKFVLREHAFAAPAYRAPSLYTA
jgi:hypothetical protein